MAFPSIFDLDLDPLTCDDFDVLRFNTDIFLTTDLVLQQIRCETCQGWLVFVDLLIANDNRANFCRFRVGGIASIV